jgi:Na+-translocating ferredoxin:NAD+ oxidoreductase RnfG subunit
MSKLRIALLVTLLGLAVSSPAVGKVFHTVKQLLAEQFKTASKVGYERIAVSGAQKAALERRLGYELPKNDYVVYVATRNGRPEGYAVFDQERGQHEMIDFATFFDDSGKVTRTEVMAYRENYGHEIRRASFRRQFVGRGAESGYVVGKDIDAISGATISADSMSRAVKRAAVLLDVCVLPER